MPDGARFITAAETVPVWGGSGTIEYFSDEIWEIYRLDDNIGFPTFNDPGIMFPLTGDAGSGRLDWTATENSGTNILTANFGITSPNQKLGNRKEYLAQQEARSKQAIVYGGNPFDVLTMGTSVPLVAMTNNIVRYGERNHVVDVFTLNGTLVSQMSGVDKCNLEFTHWLSAKERLLQKLSNNFQEFKILVDDTVEYICDYAIIKSITFPSQTFSNILRYQVEIECRRPDYFTGFWGVLEPVNQVNYQTNNDGTIQITHTIGARGFNTTRGEYSSSAIENALSFCRSGQGLNNVIVPLFFDIASGSTCLRSVSEKINRLNGTCSIEEVYLSSNKSGDSSILSYTSDLSSGIDDGITSVTVNGELLGCKNQNIEELRTLYRNINLYSLATGAYDANNGLSDTLFEFPIISGTTESINDKKISFNITYNNDTGNFARIDYSASLTQDFPNDLAIINLNGAIRARGNYKNRWELVTDLYDDTDLVGLATSAYNAYGLEYLLNPLPLSQSTTFNPYSTEIGFSISMNNRPISPCAGLKSLDSTLSIRRGLNKYKSEQLINQLQGDANNFGNIPLNLDYWSRAEATLNLNANIFNPPTGDYTCVELLVDNFKNEYLLKPKAYLERDRAANRYSDFKIINREVVISYEDEDAPSRSISTRTPPPSQENIGTP